MIIKRLKRSVKQLSANYNNYNNVFTVKINIIIMYSIINRVEYRAT